MRQDDDNAELRAELDSHLVLCAMFGGTDEMRDLPGQFAANLAAKGEDAGMYRERVGLRELWATRSTTFDSQVE